jgi:integrase
LEPNKNPTSGVDLLADNGARERYLSKQEVKNLFDVLNKNRNVQVGQVIKLLLYTGARKREILDAKWEFIDFEARVLTVPLSKSGKPRYISLSDSAVDLLNSLPREKDVPWVFFNPKTKKPLVSIFCAWDSIRKKAGIPEVRIHDLRHSFASFLVNSGRSLYEVQKLLGHYDPKVTMRYAHLSQSGLVDAVNSVNHFID